MNDNSAEIVELGPHDNMTPEEALAVTAREPWERVVIMGFQKGNDDVVVRSSHMVREHALWILEHAKVHILNWDGPGTPERPPEPPGPARA